MQAVADLLEQCAEGEGSTLAEHKGLRSALRNATEALNQSHHALRRPAHGRARARGAGRASGSTRWRPEWPKATPTAASAHPRACAAAPRAVPEGLSFDGRAGRKLVDELLAHGIAIEHACEKVCACATCHVHLREGAEYVAPPTTRRKTSSTTPGAWTRSRACPAA
jgi:ferredoxin